MLYNKRILFPLWSFFLFISFHSPAKSAIIASIKPIGFIVSAIADGVMPVEVLLPEGASEHNYTLRPSDIKRLQEADLIVWIGSDMEGFIRKVSNAFSDKRNLELATLSTVKPLLIVRSTKEEKYLNDNEKGFDTVGRNYYGQYNTHLWMSPEIARQFAIAVHEKLLKLVPHNKKELDANLQQFKIELIKNDEQIVRKLAPFKKKGYFVFHDAYAYFEKYYGLTPLGYFTVNPGIQPGVQRLYQIRSQLVKQKAICVFSEPQFKSDIIDTIIRGTNARKGMLDPLGIDIKLGKRSYVKFLSNLSNQYVSCLKKDAKSFEGK